jgi:hypothetical protein
MEPTTKPFSELVIGDLFKVGEEKYRKIPAIEIPGAGERNAAQESNQGWVYISPETAVQHYGHVDLAVDRVRAGRQESPRGQTR